MASKHAPVDFNAVASAAPVFVQPELAQSLLWLLCRSAKATGDSFSFRARELAAVTLTSRLGALKCLEILSDLRLIELKKDAGDSCRVKITF